VGMMNPNMGMGMNQNVGMGMGMNMEPAMGMNQNMGANMGGANMGKGGVNSAGRGTLRRKVTRRPTARRVTAYDEEDGDDGFVTGEYEEFEMANIRVKVCPCGRSIQKNTEANISFSSSTTRATCAGWRFRRRRRSKSLSSA
jgi:hypothetical protein